MQLRPPAAPLSGVPDGSGGSPGSARDNCPCRPGQEAATIGAVSDRLLRIAALSAAVLSVAVALAALALAIQQGLQPREAAGAVLLSSWSVCGALLAWARPRNALGWLLLLVGVSDALGAFASTLGTWVLRGRPGSDLGLVIAWLGSFYWPIGALVPVTLLLVLYPTGRPPSRRWRPVLFTSAAGIGLLCLGLAISTDSFDDVVPGARLPFTPPVWLSAIGGALTVVLLVPSVLIGVFGTALRLRRAGQPERQQLSAHSAGHRIRAVLLRRRRCRQRAPARPGVRGRTGRSGRRGTALQPARHRGRSTSKSPFPRATRSATPTDGS